MRSSKILAATAALVSVAANPALAQQSTGPAPYIGQVKYFAGNFCPKGSLQADGSILSIARYTPLFALLGTNFGGDGRTNFGIPDLGGRFAVGASSTIPIRYGEMIGNAEVTLTPEQMPAHRHEFYATTAPATLASAPGNALATFAGAEAYAQTGGSQVALHANSITESGGGEGIDVQDPYLTVMACIYVAGVYPSRS